MPHTPGPWSFDPERSGIIRHNSPASVPTVGTAVASLYAFPWNGEKDSTHQERAHFAEARANGHLIAAAPRLLAALERMTHPMASDEDRQHALDLIAEVRRAGA